MRESILNVLRNTDRALDIDELQESLEISTAEELEILLKDLKQLEEEVLIYHSNKNKYMLLENSHLRKGIMRVNKKGFGFVEVENLDDDIYVSQENMNGAIHDDVVLVEITSKMNLDRLEGRVLKILARKMTNFVGVITFDDKGIGHIQLDDNKIKLMIEIPKGKSLNAVDGHKVVVRLEKKLNSSGRYEGRVMEILGHQNDPGVDILSIIYKYNIPVEFSDEVKNEVKHIPMEVSEEEMKDRRDLREETIFTIDGDDTKDIDDAISIKILSNGHYQLGVHIADVSYYVREGTALNEAAEERGTSVYLVDRVIPMIPHELSNGICSLNPNVDRLAISCVMEFDGAGKQLDYEIFPSVIRSRIQMTYKKVNSILEKDQVPDEYEPYVYDLKTMAELADILRKAKIKRGYIDFAVDEAKILVDENCVPTDVVLRDRGTGEKLIEDFMIAANECVATHIYFMNLPFIYRIHETPEEDKIRSFLGFVSGLGYHVNGDLKDLSPKFVQDIVFQLEDKPEYKILSNLLLRSMKKAIYSPDNLGHYGLASDCYTHFTSPIRRFPDTTVHRLLHTYLFDGHADMETVHKWEEKLPGIAEHSSERERASVDCEREVDDMKMAEYMEKHIGETFEGMISSITSFGMFVELDNLIEGLVPLRELDDFYHFDEEHLTLTGEKSHMKYSIGERVVVKVVRANKEEKTVDFEIVRKVS
ncbi:MAG: ribonuclease R [Bacilli bacterium]|nr:ribonuclease R [Bacilli bacterium]